MPAVSCLTPFIALSTLVVPQRIGDRLWQKQGPSRLHRLRRAEDERRAAVVVCGALASLGDAEDCDGTRALGRFYSGALGWPLIWDQDEETAIHPAAPGGTCPNAITLTDVDGNDFCLETP